MPSERGGSSGSREECGVGASPVPVAEPTAAEIVAAFRTVPLAAVMLVEGVVIGANEAFARTLGVGLEDAIGKPLAALLPPDEGEVPIPGPGNQRVYRTRVGGVPARVDLAGAPAPRPDGSLLVSGIVTVHGSGADTAEDRALLALSRELAGSRSERDISAALARALDLLFPGRSFAIRLVEPRTLALTSLHAHGRLRSSARARIALRRAAAEEAGLAAEALAVAGVVLVERDEPLFEGSETALALPLAVDGELFGVVTLEYARGAPGWPEGDAPLLARLANHATLGVRNARSIEELTLLRTRHEDLLEHANALICAVDRQRVVTAWNAALVRLSGWEKGEVIGSDLVARLHPDDRRRAADAIARSFAGEAVHAMEVRLLRRDRGESRIAVSTAPAASSSGEVEGVIWIAQDLTLLRSMQAAAEHAERLAAIGRLVAGVVHELNNPLTAVTMYSGVLVEKLSRGGDPADLEKLRAIQEAGGRIQRLARDLVAYAHPTGAKTEAVDLGQVIEEAARLAKPVLKETEAVLERRLNPAPPVEGNRASLVQVALALVTNAAQAISRGGRIRLAVEAVGATTTGAAGATGTIGTIGVTGTTGTTGATGGEVKLVVTDDGAGMPPEVAARAFEPFFTTKTGIGIGLGLPIVAGIVERHGGTVALETAPGKGTTVTVSLPARR
jgi:PAS domain S-box-containing protein